MGSKMLIDAAHPEETRVVVFNGNKIEEFDYESADRKQLKGSIYLAKITRVEPSLQAAFVDYGGNRHGFLAFSEIHPDYYQIPVADREALLREEEEEESVASDEIEEEDDKKSEASTNENDDTETDDSDVEDSENVHTVEEDSDDEIEAVGEDAADDDVEEGELEAPKRRRKRQRRYRIQEVIKRRQVILVQVVKEERGNKGAALTTYLSLAGRYCVLMPNTARGGGISRKISDPKDRKRLKEVTQAINVPDGAGLIVRTAGASRTKAEIKRDFDYLLRQWGNIRDLTLESTAPSLVYEEGNLIKRSIRDLYNKDVDEVMVEGEQGYKDAKAFMKMLMPSHAKNVKHYEEKRPLFSRYQVENHLDALYSPHVTLPSGGYLIMNQTEALVAIDINSGKATREHSIEKTALKTNIEAAVEIARQLRLRDLAGLVVVDFIDMEERRNNRAVERKLKEALKSDRARIQVGRISHFGLLEMSRQRMRQSMLEGTTMPCQHCEGTGLIRSISSSALSVLRAVEDHLINRKAENLTVSCSRDVACYILNEKRGHLGVIEQTYGIVIFIRPSDTVDPSECEIQRAGAGAGNRNENAKTGRAKPAVKAGGQASEAQRSEESSDEESKPDGRKRRRRRRGRRGRKSTNGENNQDNNENLVESQAAAPSPEASGDALAQMPEAAEAKADGKEQEKPKKRRSRKPKPTTDEATADEAEAVGESHGETEEKPKKRPRKRAKKAKKEAEQVADDAPSKSAEEADAKESEPQDEKAADKKPKKRTRKKPVKKRAKKSEDSASKTGDEGNNSREATSNVVVQDDKAAQENTAVEPARTTWQPPAATQSDAGPAKKGWWSKS
jgi:ribonuclease E